MLLVAEMEFSDHRKSEDAAPTKLSFENFSGIDSAPHPLLFRRGLLLHNQMMLKRSILKT